MAHGVFRSVRRASEAVMAGNAIRWISVNWLIVL